MVKAGGPAAAAGIREGMRLTTIEGIEMDSSSAITKASIMLKVRQSTVLGLATACQSTALGRVE